MEGGFKLLRRAGPHFSVTPLADTLEQLSNQKLVLFGEQHEEPRIIALQYGVLRSMREQAATASTSASTTTTTTPTVHLVMEHFNFDHQPLLESFQLGEMR